MGKKVCFTLAVSTEVVFVEDGFVVTKEAGVAGWFRVGAVVVEGGERGERHKGSGLSEEVPNKKVLPEGADVRSVWWDWLACADDVEGERLLGFVRINDSPEAEGARRVTVDVNDFRVGLDFDNLRIVD